MNAPLFNALSAFGALVGDGLPAAGERQAALLLHGMAPADRGWLLAELPPVQRARLDVLLDELERLGVAGDPSLVRTALGLPADVLPAPAALDPAQVQALARQLQDEPPMLVARLLRLEDWAWRESLVQALREPQRRRVRALLDTPGAAPAAPPPAALDAALRRLLDAAARPVPVPVTAAPMADSTTGAGARGARGWRQRLEGWWARPASSARREPA